MSQMNRKIINEILEEYGDRRAAAQAEAKRVIEKLHFSLPELKAIDDEIMSAGLKLVQASLDESVDYDVALERIKEETNNLRDQRIKLLEKHGYSLSVYSPIYRCSACNDSGFVGKQMCSCLKKAVAERAYKQSGLGVALYSQSFDNFNLSYYKDGDKETFSTMSKLYSDAKDYAESFTGKGNLFLIGSTGLGKTHISSSIAKTVIEKGYTVVYDSAQKIFDAFEDKKFGRSLDSDVEKFSECDLLIIDDLGTEHITQFTVSVLYNLINERCNNSKSMIISTNLTPEELKVTYKPRIFSRLLGDFKILRFLGKDIRMQKLGE